VPFLQDEGTKLTKGTKCSNRGCVRRTVLVCCWPTAVLGCCKCHRSAGVSRRLSWPSCLRGEEPQELHWQRHPLRPLRPLRWRASDVDL